MQKKRGFTLIELITVIAILAVLGTILLPSISGYAETSKDVVCISNVNLLNRIYRQEVALFPKTTPQNIIENKNSQYYSGGTQCPNGGEYSVKNSVIVCSKHKANAGDTSNKFEGNLYDRMLNALDHLSKCEALATTIEQNKCREDYYGNPSWSASGAMNRIFKDKNGNWDLLDPSITSKAGLKAPLYVRPYFGDQSKEPIIFANSYNVGSGQWYGNMVYHGGNWYKRSNGFSMTDFNNLTKEQINLKILSEFTKVE